MGFGESTGLISCLLAAGSLVALVLEDHVTTAAKLLALGAVILGVIGLIRRDTVPTTRLSIVGLVVGGVLLAFIATG